MARLLLLLALFASPARAATVTIDGAHITYREALPYGTTIRVRYGFAGNGLDWAQQGEIEAFASADNEWKAPLPGPNPAGATTLQFIVVVTTPDGRQAFDRGSVDPHGHYRLTLPRAARL